MAAVAIAGMALAPAAFADDAQQPQAPDQAGQAGQAGQAEPGAPDMGQAAPGGKMTMDKNTDLAPDQMRMAQIKVTHVDKKSHMVHFVAKVQPEANLTKDGQPIKLDQLRRGDEVRAAFDPQTGEVIKLEVIRAPAAK